MRVRGSPLTGKRTRSIQQVGGDPARYGSRSANHPMVPVTMNPFRVAGLACYAVEAAIHAMQAGDPLCLVAEPTHPHDEFAVEIWHGAPKLGYVPRSDNRHLSRLLRQGATLAGEVWEADPDATGWEMVRARVYLLT